MECLHSQNTMNIGIINEEVPTKNDELRVMTFNNQDATISFKSQVIRFCFIQK